MATEVDTELKAQLDKLTIAVQLIHDFRMSDDPSIPNPEGGVIRTLEGINAAINEAIPNFEDANEAAIQARAARDAAIEPCNLVCRLLLEKKKIPRNVTTRKY